MKKLFSMFMLIVLSILINSIKIKKDISSIKVNDYLSINSESVDLDNAETYDISVLVELKNSTSNANFFFNLSQNLVNSNTDEIDSYLRMHRQKIMNYYKNTNQVIFDSLDLNDLNYSISWYAPYVEITFDDIQEYNDMKNELNEKLENNVKVNSVVLDYNIFNESTVNSDTYSTNYPLLNAFTDIGISSMIYSGEGVRVGTIEPNTPDTTVNLKTNKFTRIGTSESEHSTLVTSIIGGTSGIAKNAHLYCIANNDFNITDCFNILINTYNVNVINMSAGSGNEGIYDNFCAYIDYIVSTT